MTEQGKSDYDARDHGGRIDAAMAIYGGKHSDWLDLSTGINPIPFAVPPLDIPDWTTLPTAAATNDLIAAARAFWSIPEAAAVLPIPGASIAIAQIPMLVAPGVALIRQPSYNEHAASFQAAGWNLTETDAAKARVLVHPNNPDGHYYEASDAQAPLTVIDESFCDLDPDKSLIDCATRPGTIILKSFGKFWGLAGLRLGFAIGDPDLIQALRARIGPWPVSGPALKTGSVALRDEDWAQNTRRYLAAEAPRLDGLVTDTGAEVTGGTALFRLYDHPRASELHEHLARNHIWTRLFPWSDTAIRFGLPVPSQWPRLTAALQAFE